MHKNLYQWLKERGYQVLVEKEVGEKFALPEEVLATVEEIGEQAQLVIVIGGDGNMLGRARILAKYHIPMIGINRGNLGFLTDIDPKNAYAQLEACLERGEFFVEERFLLEAKIERNGEIISSGNAVNEAVIHPAKIAHMIDFHVYINDKFDVFSAFRWLDCFHSHRFNRLFAFRRRPNFNAKFKCDCPCADVPAYAFFSTISN